MGDLEALDLVAVAMAAFVLGFVVGLLFFHYAFPCPADMTPEYLSRHG